jgi:spore germination protein
LLILELAFELIREAGVRVPGALGNAIGIVGGLIIGDAAVSANLVSPIVVIIVALTALGSMAIPNEEFASAFRLCKYGFLFAGGYLGMYGIVLGVYLLVGHLASLQSFGMPYLLPFTKPAYSRAAGEGIFRLPFRKRKYRPLYAKAQERIRLRIREDRNTEGKEDAQDDIRGK